MGETGVAFSSSTMEKRKDSGLSESSDAAGATTKTRDFAAKGREAAATTVPIQAKGGDEGSVWRRMRVTAFSRLAGKG